MIKDTQIHSPISEKKTALNLGISVFLAGMVLSAGLFWNTRRLSLEEMNSHFQMHASEKTRAVTEGITDHLSGIRLLERFIKCTACSGNLGAEEFGNIAAPFTEGRGLQALCWVPLVHKAHRADFEDAAGRKGRGSFEIVEIADGGGRTRAAGRDIHYPVLFAEPVDGNENILGLDLACVAEARAALTAATESGESAATGFLILGGERRSKDTFLIFTPVLRPDSPPAPPRERLSGFLLSVFRAPDMTQAFLRQNGCLEDGEGISFSMMDQADSTNNGMPHGRPAKARHDGGLRQENDLEFAGRSWHLTVTAHRSFMKEHAGQDPWLIILFGPVLSILAALYLHGLISHRHRTEALVKKSTEELREHQDYLRTMWDNLPQGIMLVDLNSHEILEVNQEAARLIGAPPAAIVGNECHRVICPAERGRCPISDLKQDVENSERTLLTARGDSVPIIKTVKPVTLLGRACLLEAFIDNRPRIDAEEKLKEANLRLQKAAEEAKRMAAEAELANAAKGEFLARMSHEIRTPLNGVIGMTDLIASGGLPGELQEYANIAKRSAEDLLDIINDVLDFSKIEAGKLRLENVLLDIHELAFRVVESFRESAGRKGLEILLLVDNSIPVKLRGDPGRLRQILVNLVDNAIKFTERGEVFVRVEMAEAEKITGTERESVLVRFSIKDTGVGISSENQGRLFQAFTQADASISRRFGGTGLGLAISKNLAELMGGAIGVESEEGKGSTFRFTARLAVPADDQAPPGHARRLAGTRILAVDDNRTNLMVLSEMLKDSGCEFTATDRPAGVLGLMLEAHAGGRPFGMVMLDKLMPELGGEELGMAIRRTPELKGTSLVLMTSFGQKGEGEQVWQIGFSAIISKPVKAALLMETIQTAVGQRRGPGEGSAEPCRERDSGLPRGNKSGRRVLVVEDQPVNQRIAEIMLGKMGLACRVVPGGSQALEELRRERYDLVIMDVNMPDLDGLETTRMIRGRAGGTMNEDIPIIAMTAHAVKGDEERCLKAGMNDYIPKPVKRELLEKLLKKYLRDA